MNQLFPNASGVLKRSTLSRLLAEVGRQGQVVVDSWASKNPKQVKEWEKDGSLLSRAKQAQEQFNQAKEMADRDGVKHLADHEVSEIYGGPSLDL